MKLYPTLNIQQGRVIPTAGGLPASDMDPLRMAEHLLDQGAQCLALVDVDAARGVGHNRELIGRILARGAARERRPCEQ
ncbi:MAG TPA: HisA/HisF-related TIM barrel protein, partial [Holophagaceae bacterium]|nr:HisA/HisF-related TIM barrel protein [Holophagaceae bacterium]